jgi:hypothetical protein
MKIGREIAINVKHDPFGSYFWGHETEGSNEMKMLSIRNEEFNGIDSSISINTK